jgi:hypothetical protein
MKKIILLLALAIFTTSCVSLEGNILVTEKMSLKKKGGFLNLGKKNVVIEANQYDAHLTVLGQNNFALILKKGDERISIPLKSKNDLKLPTFDGEIKISHNDIYQPYDLKGIIQTDIYQSATQEVIESCSWNTYETRCRIECSEITTRDSQGISHVENNCQKMCGDVLVTHQGRQEVIFHNTTTHRDLRFEFLKADSLQSVAHFQGQSSETERIIERKGICN